MSYDRCWGVPSESVTVIARSSGFSSVTVVSCKHANAEVAEMVQEPGVEVRNTQ